MRTDLHYLNYAIKIAEASQHSFRARHAAVLVYKNEILATGVNLKKSHPFHFRFMRNSHSIFLHAETSCIYNALKSNVDNIKNLKKSILYIARVKYDNDSLKPTWGISAPCTGCERAIVEFDIPRVVYTTDSNFVIESREFKNTD